MSVNGTDASFNLTGNDPDGDALNWTLSFGDNSTNETGSLLPSNVTHAYLAGTFNASFALTDGQLTATYNVTVTVEASAPAGESQAVTAEWRTGGIGCLAPINPWVFGTPANGVDVYEFAVEPGTIGKPFTATFEATAAVLFWGVDFFDGAPPAAPRGGAPALAGAGARAGTVATGAVHGLFYSCGSGGTAQYTAG